MAVTRVHAVVNPGAIAVSPSAGEFLHFRLDTPGPKPIFSFASNVKGPIFDEPDLAGPVYNWDHLKNPSDIQQLELLNLGMSFITNASYRYVVELRSPGAAPVVKLDATFTGAPTDIASESFTVVIR